MMNFEIQEAKYPSQFNFMQIWSIHDDYKDILAKTWETNVVSCPMFILDKKKLKLLKSNMKIWNKKSFGNINERVKQPEDELNNI